ALVEANPVYHFEDIIRKPEEYIKLNDSILYKIEYEDRKKDLESLIASYRKGNNKDPNKVFNLDTYGICYIFPKQYEETILRIFACDPEKVDSIQNAFQEFTKSIGLIINEGFLPDENVDFLDINLK
ncbi:7399_t:CDS:2, partial [Gigaspora rosea]